MMIFMIWLLFLTSLMIFILCLVLIIVKPPLQEPQGNHHSISHPYQQNKNNEINALKETDIKQISILNPEISILFETIESEKAYILRYKGISRNNEYVLYVLQNESSKSCFMNAIERMIEENDTPFYNILIAFVYDDSSNDHLLEVLQDYTIKYIYTDESGIQNLPNTEGSTAFIGVGRKPFAILNIQHEMDDHEWLSTLNSYSLFTPVYTTVAHQACISLKDTMEAMTSFELLLSSLFKSSIMYDYMLKYPETISWFCSVMDKEDTKIVVYSPDVLSLDDAIQQIKASALKKNIDISVEKKVTQMNLLEDKVMYEMIQKIAHDTLKTEHELPILCENYAEWNTDIPVISFAPTMQGQIDSIHRAIDFYRDLLLQHKKA